MPMLEISTNVKTANIPSDFLVETSKTFQEIIGKPLQYIAVHLHVEQLMAFGGTTDPCALVEFVSAGKISLEENIGYSKVLTELVGKLGVPPDRMYINFVDMSRDNIGFKGTTLSGLDKLAGKK